MIQSMTGFGRGSAALTAGTLTVELKSVNSRFLEIHSRIPREYPELEIIAKAKIKSVLLRGRVDLTMNMEASGAESVVINEPLLQKFLNLGLQLSQKYGLKDSIDIAQLLRLPKVVEVSDQETVSGERWKAAFEQALESALFALQEFRANEGRNLTVDMLARLSALQEYSSQIDRLAVNLVVFYKEKLAERMKALLPEGMVSEERIMMEAAMLAEKSDISEELERLRSHIGQFQGLMANGADAGRRLDFLLQEMNRETNTILSKATLLEVSRIGVEMKAEIEKLREQVQNIE